MWYYIPNAVSACVAKIASQRGVVFHDVCVVTMVTCVKNLLTKTRHVWILRNHFPAIVIQLKLLRKELKVLRCCFRNHSYIGLINALLIEAVSILLMYPHWVTSIVLSKSLFWLHLKFVFICFFYLWNLQLCSQVQYGCSSQIWEVAVSCSCSLRNIFFFSWTCFDLKGAYITNPKRVGCYRDDLIVFHTNFPPCKCRKRVT